MADVGPRPHPTQSSLERCRRPAGRRLAIILAVGLTLGCTGCAGAGRSLIDAAASINQTRTDRWALVTGDVVNLEINGLPEYTQEITVPAHGNIHLRGTTGEIQAIGLTVTELRDLAQLKYAEIQNPKVSVHLTSIAPRQIGVMGMVERPGAITLDDREVTLLEALARAGGPDLSRARLTQLLLVRWDPVNKQQLTWILDARIAHWPDAPPLFLQPHDVIYVPNTPIDKANIWVDKYIRQMIPLPLPASAL